MCHKYLRKTGVSTRYFFDLADVFQSKGHEVVFFSMDDPRNIETSFSKYFVKNIDYNITKSWFQYLKEGMHAIYSTEAGKKVELLIKDTKPEGVFLHDIQHHLSPSILHVFKKCNLPVVLHLSDFFLVCPSYRLLSKGAICEKCRGGKFYHAIRERCFRDSWGRSAAAALVAYIHRAIKIYENNVDFFIAPSRFVMDKYIDMGFDRDKIVLIPQAISIDQLHPRPGEGDYVLYFGVLEKWKGVATLIRAMQDVPGAKLVIAGDGREKANLEEMAQREGIGNVEFVGYKAGDDLWEVVGRALFVVVPSEWYEVYGMVTYEAFANGKPVIGSNIGGTAELIDHGISGLLFEPGNVGDLSEKIKRLLADPGLIAAMGKNARRKVETVITPLNNYKSIISLFTRYHHENY
jgi:glycosyltransferase involved in cell wall biosynthesis